ncbi:Thymidine kinase (EC [Olavius algarvensis Delta 1 endosymbiont]|nr:Thymidine kinase (EC [Olavius algarvensis Delta 1 endosymbiont]
MAKLYFRYGAMNCGKSTSLIQVDYNYRERNMSTVIIKPATDTKGSDKVLSRLDVERRVDVLTAAGDDLYEIVEAWQKEKGPVHCALVDEAQFLTVRQVDQLFEVAVLLNIPVICYGLRTDFLLNGFEGSARLLLMAHSIEELKTICKCGQKAIANGRKIGGRFVFEGAQVAIEGKASVEYESLCAQCYFKYKKEYENLRS